MDFKKRLNVTFDHILYKIWGKYINSKKKSQRGVVCGRGERINTNIVIYYVYIQYGGKICVSVVSVFYDLS